VRCILATQLQPSWILLKTANYPKAAESWKLKIFHTGHIEYDGQTLPLFVGIFAMEKGSTQTFQKK